MNIDLLQGMLEVGENPGLETTDPRFSDIATLVQEGNYEEAAVKSEAILAEKIYDIRIIGYFLYGHFVEQGILPIKDIYLCFADLLSNNIDALGPVRNREKHIQTILNWLVRQLLKKLQYEEDNKSDLYTEWISGVSIDQVQEVIDGGENLRRALGPVLGDAAGPVLDGMTKINNWLQSFQRLVYREHEPEVVEEEDPDSEHAGRETEAEREQNLWEEERGQVSIKAPQDEGEMIGVEGSYHLKLLMNKLQAFDQLISMRKFASAAIVADDINVIIANFDPRIYFPNLFVKFALQCAANINNLTAYAEYKDTAAWQALQELYKIDLERFINFDPEALDLGAPGAGESYEVQDEYERMPEDEER